MAPDGSGLQRVLLVSRTGCRIHSPLRREAKVAIGQALGTVGKSSCLLARRLTPLLILSLTNIVRLCIQLRATTLGKDGGPRMVTEKNGRQIPPFCSYAAFARVEVLLIVVTAKLVSLLLVAFSWSRISLKSLCAS